jgi:uncharacterized protein (DUF1330 family)
MPAYVIARVQVTDPGRYRAYTDRTPAVIAAYGGRFLARGGEMVTLEGPEEAGRVVLLEFPSMVQARAWFESEEYQEIRKLRLEASTGSLVLVDGCPA